MKKQKHQAMNKFKKKSFLENDNQNTYEINYLTPRNRLNKGSKDMVTQVKFQGKH